MESYERRFLELHHKVTRGGILTPEELTEYNALCARLDATEMIEVKDPTETLTLRERLSKLLALRDEIETGCSQRLRTAWLGAGILSLLVSSPVAALLLAIASLLGFYLGEGIYDFPPLMIFLWGVPLGYLWIGPAAFLIGALGGWRVQHELQKGRSSGAVCTHVTALCSTAGILYGTLLGALRPLGGEHFIWAFLPIGAVVGAVAGVLMMLTVRSDYEHDKRPTRS